MAETMDDFQNELNNSMRTINVGDIVEGTVAGVSETEVTVDLQYFAEGIIRPLDYSADPNFSIKNDVHPGDVIKATVLRTDDGRGNILLSRREAMEQLAWDEFAQMKDDKTDVDIKVVDAVKGGVVGYLNGVRAFIPASQLSLDYVEDLSTFKGQTVSARVITAEKENKRLVLSCRDALRAARKAAKEERLNSIQPGMVIEGKVQSLQSYGAFVSLGDGIDGLVHISQIKSDKRLKHASEACIDGLVHISQIKSDKRLKHASEALSVGDVVKVKVTGVKDGKISLSMRALDETPKEAPAPEEERIVLPKTEKLTTNLGSLLKGIKLD